MIYAAIAALGWGGLSGYLHARYWVVAVGALVTAGTGLWLERNALTRSAPADRLRLFLLLAPAYAFVSLVALGLISLTYFLAAWLHR
jgi:hypothetical protein